MVKTFFFIALLCVLSLSVMPARASASSDVPALGSAAQDGGGTVWARPLEHGGSDRDGTVYFWRTGVWVAQTVPEAAGFHARALTRGDNGSVYVFWQKWDGGQDQMMPPCLVTVHRGGGSRIVARFVDPFTPDRPYFGSSQRTLWVGSRNDIWLMGEQTLLWHRAADGAEVTFPLKPAECFGGPFSIGFPAHPLSSFIDGLGRRWFWQSGLNSWSPGTLRGVLIWDGKALAYHPTLPSLPDRPLSALMPQDARHLWAAQPKDAYPWNNTVPGGLYRLDTQTLTALPIVPPDKKAFQTIARIFRVNGEWCILESWSLNHPHTDLWRQHGALWHKEATALADSLYSYVDILPRALLEASSGTWLAGNGAGLYWLPRGGSPAVRVDWRRGLTTGQVSDLFRLPNGNIMAYSSSGGESVTFPPRPHSLYPARPGVAVGEQAVPTGIGDMAADQRRHLWGLASQGNNRQALDEWDGKHWEKHLVPKGIPGVNSLYACDTLGRLWLTTSNWNPPAQPQPVEGRAVYDPAHDTWTKYDTVPEALQAAAERPGMAFQPYRNTSLPLFSSDGRVGFVSDYKLFFYDSHSWRHWETRDVKPNANDKNFEAAPRFNDVGHLAVAVDNQEWEWTPEGGWQCSGPVKPPSADPALPPGGPEDFRGTPLTDNRGAQWAAWDGNVYLIWHGLWQKQSALSGLGSPFWDRRGLYDVLQDSNGHYFFLTNPGGYSEYVVWSPPAAPLPLAPRIQIMPLAADALCLRFAATRRGPHWFQWRLNGGVWSAPQTSETARLTALRPGSYRVEAQTIDACLQASPAPSIAVFVILPASAAQIARWVQTLLSGPESAREAAVAGLVKQPADALPALQTARPAASESARWWLDAAIQQITQHNSETD